MNVADASFLCSTGIRVLSCGVGFHSMQVSVCIVVFFLFFFAMLRFGPSSTNCVLVAVDGWTLDIRGILRGMKVMCCRALFLSTPKRRSA